MPPRTPRPLQAAPIAETPRNASRSARWMPLLIVAVGVIAYWNSFQGVFIFDDEHAIIRNRYIRSLWPLSEAMSAPPQSSVSGRPIVALTLAVNHALGGLNPWGYHLFNLIVHLLAGLALYGIARRTFQSRHEVETSKSQPAEKSKRRPEGTQADHQRIAIGRACEARAAALGGVCAMIWLVHPLQTESVTYIIQRAEAIMGLFYLSTLYFALRGMNSLRPRGWLAASVVICALGMASKEVMATAPILVALYDRVFVSPSWREVFARRKIFYVALFGTWIILGVIVAGAPRSDSAGFGLKEMTPITYMLMQFNAVLLYLRLSFWPASLCLDYWAPPVDSRGQAIAQGFVIALLLAGTIWLLVRRPHIGYWCAWVFVVLAPTSSFIPIADPVFEHRMYVPLAGLVMAAVLASAALFRRMDTARARKLGIASAAIVILALTARTIARNADYHDGRYMWEQVVRLRPKNPRALTNLSIAHLERREVAEALAACEQAIRIAPHYHDAYNHLAKGLVDLGDPEAAITAYRKGLAIKPNDYQARTNLGEALLRVGRTDEAIDAFRQAIAANPREPLPHFNLGRTLQTSGREAECIEPYRACLAIEPDNFDARANLASALAVMGKFDDSEAEYAELFRRSPDHASALYSRALARTRAGRIDAAMDDYRRAITLDPAHADARCNLGVLYKQAGRRSEAMQMFRAGIQADPRHVPSHYNLGVSWAEQGQLDEAAAAFEAALKVAPDHEPSRQALAATRSMKKGGPSEPRP